MPCRCALSKAPKASVHSVSQQPRRTIFPASHLQPGIRCPWRSQSRYWAPRALVSMSDEEPKRETSLDRDLEELTEATEDFKAFVGGISWHMDDKQLRDTFKKYGATDARVMLDRMTNRSRGFGFVHFRSKEDLDEAVERLHNTEIDGRRISVTRAIPQDSIQPGTPAAAIGRRGDRPAPERRYERLERPPPRGYERYPPRAYERGPYDRYPEYERGYDRYAYGYERDYPRDPYARVEPYDRYAYPDPYERDPYYGAYGRVRDPYDTRGFPDRYEPERRPGPYDRLPRSSGPEREYGRYPGPSSRPAPYERAGMNGRPI